MLPPGAAPGPHDGSSVAQLRSDNDSAVFIGDLLHSPMQILHPDHRCSFGLNSARPAPYQIAS